MNKYIKIPFNKNNSIEVEKGYIVDNYLSKKDGAGYSIVRTHLDGTHPFMKNIKSNRSYFFITGSAIFKIDDEIVEVSEGDVLVIPKNTKFGFKGKFDAILIDSPAFNPNDDVIYNEIMD